jgi:hypothetical protein
MLFMLSRFATPTLHLLISVEEVHVEDEDEDERERKAAGEEND